MKSAKNTLKVLEYICKNQPISLQGLSQALDLPKSNVQRSLYSLRDSGWVKQVKAPTLKWVSTPKTIALGYHASMALENRNRVLKHLQDVSNHCKATAIFTVMNENGMCLMDFIQNGDVYDLISQPAEIPKDALIAPMHASAHGKVCLANMPEQMQLRYVEENRGKLKEYTSKTITDMRVLQDEMQVIRERGYSVSIGELSNMLSGIAVSITDYNKNVFGAIGIVIPTLTIPEENILKWGKYLARKQKEVRLELTYY